MQKIIMKLELFKKFGEFYGSNCGMIYTNAHSTAAAAAAVAQKTRNK